MSEEPLAEQPKPNRGGGSKKGRTFKRIPRTDDNPLKRRTLWMLQKDFDFLVEKYGSFTEGVVKLVTAARREHENKTFRK